MDQQNTPPDARPDFMIALGLLPPYSVEDVHKAYRAKALAAHPDQGGSSADFLKLQETRDRALEYVKFQEGRRGWLATQVEPYLRQQELIAQIEGFGGRVELESIDWIERSFGDFAVLVERLRAITLHNCPDGDAVLKQLADKADQLGYLRTLDVSGSAVSDAGLESLLPFRGLERINLSRTRVTGRGLQTLTGLRHLKSMTLTGTRLGWWTRWRLRMRFPGVELLT